YGFNIGSIGVCIYSSSIFINRDIIIKIIINNNNNKQKTKKRKSRRGIQSRGQSRGQFHMLSMDEIIKEWLSLQANCINLIVVVIVLLYLIFILETLLKLCSSLKDG
ncbi:MAG: hypothetical protein QW734_09375, partial [Candidatus Bathyarchaeia archaeon]